MTGSVPAVSGLTTPRDDVLETLRNQLAGARRELTELRALMARADAATTAEALKSGHVATESLTVDDLNRLAKLLESIERHANGALILEAINALPGLLAAAREVEGLRAEVEAVRKALLRTAGELLEAEVERDAAVARADTAERHLTAIRQLHQRDPNEPGYCATCVHDFETGARVRAYYPCQTLRAAGPVPVTPVTEDQGCACGHSCEHGPHDVELDHPAEDQQ